MPCETKHYLCHGYYICMSQKEKNLIDLGKVGRGGLYRSDEIGPFRAWPAVFLPLDKISCRNVKATSTKLNQRHGKVESNGENS